MSNKILVVDDETEIADLIEVYLKNENYTVFKFYTAQEALNCIETTPIDLAILDIMLPDIDGFTLCKKIREHHTYPIIMLTAKSMAATYSDASCECALRLLRASTEIVAVLL